ncbi:DUF1971 domain-containing protein [Anaeromicrobium sediminis]|uniref:TehB/YeaR-like domain-containing protein n=1 Tax=Anaeromicrobium sediminis TaxID=1478221 RepID=A0A267MNH6_9FIRM|nr:DUF1971 domain-containing protein [Anaeromicrobium sediminis]PAB61086.1 hypothetical protein CCE28_01265 [Anaeromicrobium sediminis]
MNYQNVSLPEGAAKIGETPIMNENTVAPGILNKHMAPKGKYGNIVVLKGSLDYVWEDTPEDVITADVDHPIVISPERYHHVIITGEVEFKVEFYEVKETETKEIDKDALRPGEDFI